MQSRWQQAFNGFLLWHVFKEGGSLIGRQIAHQLALGIDDARFFVDEHQFFCAQTDGHFGGDFVHRQAEGFATERVTYRADQHHAVLL